MTKFIELIWKGSLNNKNEVFKKHGFKILRLNYYIPSAKKKKNYIF